MKKLIFILAALMIVLPVVSGTTEVYVNDDEDATGCPGYNFTTITEAIDQVPDDTNINVCNGTYNNAIDINNGMKMTIKAEDPGGVEIWPTTGNIGINITDSNQVHLRNLYLGRVGTGGIRIENSDTLELEDITIERGHGTNAYGIEIKDSSDIDLQGDIEIFNLNGSASATGISIDNSQEVIFTSPGNLKIKNLADAAMLWGMDVKDSDVTINKPVEIKDFKTDYYANGISISSSNVTFLKSVDIGTNADPLDTGENLAGIMIIGGEKRVNFESSVSIEHLYSDSGWVHGVDASGDLTSLKGDTSIKELSAGDNKPAKAVSIEGSQAGTGLIMEELTIESISGQESYVLFSNNSKIFAISNFSVDGGMSGTDKEYGIYLENSTGMVSDYEYTGTGMERCIGNYRNSTLTVLDSDISSCEQPVFVSKSKTYLFDPILKDQPPNIWTVQEGDAFTEIKYTVDLSFENKDGQPIEVSRVDYKSNSVSTEGVEKGQKLAQDLPEEIALKDIALMKKDVEVSAGSQATKKFEEYKLAVSKPGYSQWIGNLPLAGTVGQQASVEMKELPDALKSLKVKTNEEKQAESFPAEEKQCTEGLISESYGCYDINQAYQFQDEQTKYTLLNFTIPETWIQDNNILKGKVSLLHYDDGWSPLDTEYIKTENGEHYYQANITSFSEFAIIGPSAQCIEDSDCPDGYNCVDETCECTLTCKEDELLDQQNCECVVQPECGNGACEEGENYLNCQVDCEEPEENITDENVTDENVTEDNVTEDNTTEYNYTRGNITEDNETGDNVTGDNVTEENITGGEKPFASALAQPWMIIVTVAVVIGALLSALLMYKRKKETEPEGEELEEAEESEEE